MVGGAEAAGSKVGEAEAIWSYVGGAEAAGSGGEKQKQLGQMWQKQKQLFPKWEEQNHLFPRSGMEQTQMDTGWRSRYRAEAEAAESKVGGAEENVFNWGGTEVAAYKVERNRQILVKGGRSQSSWLQAGIKQKPIGLRLDEQKQLGPMCQGAKTDWSQVGGADANRFKVTAEAAGPRWDEEKQLVPMWL